jgi:Ca-activated chloride channel family protein
MGGPAVATDPLSPWLARPEGLALLALMPFVALGAWWAARRRRQALQAWLGDPLPVPGWDHGRRRGRQLRSLAVFLLIAGTAGPQWGRDPDAPPVLGRDVWVVLDVSRSMLAEDRPPASRLDRAKTAVRELAAELRRRGDYRLGLIAFAGRARLLCPLTDDFDHFAYALDVLAHPDRLGPAARVSAEGEGTSLRAALELAAGVTDEAARGYQHLVLISDGDDLAGGWQVGAARLKQAGYGVLILGVGDPGQDSFIPAGGGDYLRYTDEDGTVRRATTRRHDALLRDMAEAVGGAYQPEEATPQPLLRWFRDAVAGLPLREWIEDRGQLLVARYGWFYGGALVALVLGWWYEERPGGVEL